MQCLSLPAICPWADGACPRYARCMDLKVNGIERTADRQRKANGVSRLEDRRVNAIGLVAGETFVAHTSE